MSRKREPFDGPIPQVEAGDQVECRGACGEHWTTLVALGPARYDDEHAIGRTVWLSVPVTTVAEWERDGAKAQMFANWPAEDVRMKTVTP